MAISTADATAATAAGVASVTVSMLGVEPQLLVYAACGAFVGLSSAPQTGRWRAIGTFLAVVLLSAAFGHGAADWLELQSAGAARALAGVFGLVFHPLAAVVIKTLPDLVSLFTARRMP